MERSLSIDRCWFQCIRCGKRTGLFEERAFKCSECDGLLEVRNDFSFIKGPDDVARLKTFFQERAGGLDFTAPAWQKSGVWRYRELIAPHLPEEDIVTLGEGLFPILEAGRHLSRWVGDTLGIYVLLQGAHPTDSFKDAGMPVAVSVGKAAGIKTAFCSSTGDTSAAAAAYCAASGIKCCVLLPKGKVTASQMVQPMIYGAKIILVPDNFDGCMRAMEYLVEKGAYPLNSLNSNRIEGHQTSVFQLAQFFRWTLPDWIVVPIGNGSNCASVGKGMRLLKELGFISKTARILGCQSTAASPLGLAWGCLRNQYGAVTLEGLQEFFRPVQVGETAATAARIGNPVSVEKDMRELIWSNGQVVVVPEEDIRQSVRECGKDGHFVCPQTGIAIGGARLALQMRIIKPGETVAIISTANGLKFTESAADGLEGQIVEAPDSAPETIARMAGLL